MAARGVRTPPTQQQAHLPAVAVVEAHAHVGVHVVVVDAVVALEVVLGRAACVRRARGGHQSALRHPRMQYAKGAARTAVDLLNRGQRSG